MLRKIISLSKKFISIKSAPDNSKALKKILELASSNLKEYKIDKFEKKGFKSALFYNQNKRPKRFKVILNGHLDVIPGKESQYRPSVKGNKLYGAGAMDMKAGASSLIFAFKNTASKVSYPLGLQLVTDEEVGGFNGTKYQIEKGVRADFVIVGESTNLNIENKAKGVFWAKIFAKGKSAHGAYPWKGENAIWKMTQFLNALEKNYPNPKEEKWVTTLNLSTICSSNKTFNKIPDNCEAWLDIRYIPERSESIVKDIKKLLPKGFRLEIEALEPALSTPSNNFYLRTLKQEIEKVAKRKVSLVSANGSSDARHFARVHCPAVEFGPIGEGMGSDSEWVDINSLGKHYQILKNFLLTL